MSQWAELNKRSKCSDAVKSLLATSSTTLVCNIAEVRIIGGLILRGAYYYGVFIIYIVISVLLQQMSNSCDQVCGTGVKGDSQSSRTKVNCVIQLVGINLSLCRPQLRF